MNDDPQDRQDGPQDRQDGFQELADKLSGKYGLDFGSGPDDLSDAVFANDAPRYDVRGKIASGGMGEILEVWDGHLRRGLAMKIIRSRDGGTPGGADTDPRLLSRFLEEAQVSGQLEHPGVVPVHDLGVDENNRAFFTMRHVKGRDLRAIFDVARAGEEGWSVTRAAGVMLRVCETMAYAHSKGVIHRDLKPANVMVGKFGETYVMDWGLAQVVGKEDRHDLRLREDSDEGETSVLTTDRQDQNAQTPGARRRPTAWSLEPRCHPPSRSRRTDATASGARDRRFACRRAHARAPSRLDDPPSSRAYAERPGRRGSRNDRADR
jgi:serine/threonine protein kinase